MTQPSLFSLEEIPKTGDLKEIEALVGRRDELVGDVTRVNAKLALAQAAHNKALAPLNKQLAALDKRLAHLVLQRRRSILNHFGKVVKLPGGTIRYRIDTKSLDTPKVVTAIVNFLLTMRGGKKYLTLKWSLDRDALAQASEHVIARLRPLGVRVVRHEHITIKSDSEEEPTTLVRRPYHAPQTS